MQNKAPSTTPMKSKFLDSTLALAVLSALLFAIGHGYDAAYLSRLHLPLNEYLPSSYLEIARPFDIVFIVLQTNWKHFLTFTVLIAVVTAVGSVVWALWPPFRIWLASIVTFLRRIPVVAYLVIAMCGFIALSNWITNFGWTQADKCIEIGKMPYPDWVITLKDKEKQQIRCRLTGTSSECCYVVVLGNGEVKTIPKDSVSEIGYDPTIN
jgi:hypothetical protein